MADTVVIEAEPEPEIVVEEAVAEEAAVEAVELSTTIDLVTRVTRCEDAIGMLTSVVEQHGEMLSAHAVVEEVQQQEIEAVAEEVEEVAEEAADAMEEVTEDIEEGSEEITPDEIPTVQTHPFFRKWGRAS